MKILGLTYYNSAVQAYMKPDSALLVNDKPFFLPDFAQVVKMKPCLVARVNRLGRNVEQRFAYRYYDALTIGLNMCATDLLEQAIEHGASWVEGLSFDNSLVVGEFQPVVDGVQQAICLMRNEEMYCELNQENLIVKLDEAIERLTRFVTIRMGDLIAVDFCTDWIDLQPEDKWHAIWKERKMLFCRIK